MRHAVRTAILAVIKGKTVPPRQRGAYYKDGWLYATDNCVLLRVPYEYHTDGVFFSEETIKDGTMCGERTKNYPPVWTLAEPPILDVAPLITTSEKVIRVIKLLTTDTRLDLDVGIYKHADFELMWC